MPSPAYLLPLGLHVRAKDAPQAHNQLCHGPLTPEGGCTGAAGSDEMLNSEYDKWMEGAKLKMCRCD